MPIDPTTGRDARSPHIYQPTPATRLSPNPSYAPPGPTHGPGSRYGLAPIVAFGMVAADAMLFGGLELPSGFLLTFVSFFFGLALVVPCCLGQRYIYGDSWGAAIAKGCIVGILTAIPTPLPSVLTATLGVVGAFEMKQRRAFVINHDHVN